jgi:type VI secretion system FHA domain protein
VNLILEVSGPDVEKRGIGRKVVSPSGGSIGRLPENSLVLEDPHVSSRHAVIHFVDGAYYLEDKSRNGISINTLDNRLEKGSRYRLNSGDRIFIEPYEITVSLAGGLGDSDPTDPFGIAASAQPIRGSESNFGALGLDSRFDSAPLRRGEDLIEGLVGPPPRPAPEARGVRDLEGKSVLHDHIRPPTPVQTPPPPEPGDARIPSSWNDSSIISPLPVASGEASARPEANPVKRPSSPPRSAVGSDLAAMLEAAGLHDVQVTPELAENFGQILRVVVTGVMDILQARQQTKDEFGMPMTVFKRADNNPLKFSANVEDALHNLLVKRNPAYLGPVDAFQDAFDDLRSHQMAVLAGVREAFTAMLTQFDPDTLEKQFDRQVNRGALVKVPAKLRYWELYRQWIHDMVGGDPEATYSRLFGEEFARAYEAQLKELKAHGRAKKP